MWKKILSIGLLSLAAVLVSEQDSGAKKPGRLGRFMLPGVLHASRSVQIYKNSHPLSITFTVSKHPSETLGQFIKKLRLEKGLEQRELAKKLRVHRNTVYEWESDRKGPSRKSIEKLAMFFKISRKTLEDLKMQRKKSL